MSREGAPAAGSQRGKPQPHPSLLEVDRVERFPVPDLHLVLLHVERVERRLEKLLEARNTADILRRAPPLAGDKRRVVNIGLAIADRFDEDVVPPVVAEVVDV